MCYFVRFCPVSHLPGSAAGVPYCLLVPYTWSKATSIPHHHPSLPGQTRQTERGISFRLLMLLSLSGPQLRHPE